MHLLIVVLEIFHNSLKYHDDVRSVCLRHYDFNPFITKHKLSLFTEKLLHLNTYMHHTASSSDVSALSGMKSMLFQMTLK